MTMDTGNKAISHASHMDTMMANGIRLISMESGVFWSATGFGPTSQFIGDGTWRLIEPGDWWFVYSSGVGTWGLNGVNQFRYDYTADQWYTSNSSGSNWNTIDAPMQISGPQ